MKRFFDRMENGDRQFDTRLLALIFGVGLVLRLLFIAMVRSDPTAAVDDPHYYQIIARHILEGRGYLEIRARAYRPPGFPYFLAAIYAVAGVKVLAAQVGLAICGALHPVFTALWVRQLTTRRAGYLAGLLAALHPQFIRYPQTLYSESLYFCVLSLAMLLLLRAMHSRSLGNFAIAGFVGGLAALTREGTLLLPAFVGLWYWLNRASADSGQNAGRWIQAGRGKAWLVFTGVMALTVIPWTFRNYLVLKTFVPISTNPGVNFYIGNNPTATGPMGSWKTAPGVKWNEGAGEIQAHKLGLKEGVKYAKAHPGRTVGLWAKKTVLLWAPPIAGFGGLSLPLKALRAFWLVFYLLAWGFAVYGWLAIKGQRRALLLPLLIIVGFSAPFILTYVDTRYRLPMEGFLLFYTGVGLEAFLQRRAGISQLSLLNGDLVDSGNRSRLFGSI